MQPSTRRNLPAGALIALCILALIVLCGCASSTYLPSSKSLVRSPWNSYDEIKAAFDRIQPYNTDVKDLKDLGFSPEVTPNVQVLNYLEIIQRFLPNQSLSLKDLDGGIQDCLAARDHCQAYQIIVRQ
ncbi:MAG: hypothetical protein P8130_14590, partial [Deltaproteobacteria bacterium]